jgi:hypothetical protein
MALFALLVTVPACQGIKTGDWKFFITTYIGEIKHYLVLFVLRNLNIKNIKI